MFGGLFGGNKPASQTPNPGVPNPSYPSQPYPPSQPGYGNYGTSNNLAVAEQELEMVTDLYNRIVESCHCKCIGKPYQDPDLNKGESVCIDRCVEKFFKVHQMVSEKFSQAQGMNPLMK